MSAVADESTVVGYRDADRIHACCGERMRALRRARAVRLSHRSGLRRAAVAEGPRRGVRIGGVGVGEIGADRERCAHRDRIVRSDRAHDRCDRSRRCRREQDQTDVRRRHHRFAVRQKVRVQQLHARRLVGHEIVEILQAGAVVDERVLRSVACRHRVADDLSQRVDPFGGGVRTAERAQVDESAGRRPRERVVARVGPLRAADDLPRGVERRRHRRVPAQRADVDHAAGRGPGEHARHARTVAVRKAEDLPRGRDRESEGVGSAVGAEVDHSSCRGPKEGVSRVVGEVRTTDDLSERVDRKRTAGRAAQRPEIHHAAGRGPQERVIVEEVTGNQIGNAQDLAGVADRRRGGPGPAERAEIGHPAGLAPQETVRRLVVGRLPKADHLS